MFTKTWSGQALSAHTARGGCALRVKGRMTAQNSAFHSKIHPVHHMWKKLYGPNRQCDVNCSSDEAWWCLLAWCLTLLQWGDVRRGKKKYNFLQSGWEILVCPRTYWIQLPKAKFGLESNCFLLSFCVGKATHSSGNWNVCSPPVSDPEPLCGSGRVTTLLWFIFPMKQISMTQLADLTGVL